MGTLDGRVALVTGGSGGIGECVARVLAAEGAAVAVTARRLEACEKVARSILQDGGRAVALRCDVTDYGAVEEAIRQTEGALGRPTILVNNAGVIDPIARLEASDPAEWARNITINLVGAYNAVRAFLPVLKTNGGGVIVNVSSGAAHRPLEGWSAYCAGKAGMAMLTRSIALEEEGSGIRVYGFQPGTTDTEMQVTIRASGVNPISQIPREKLLPVQIPSRVIAWLCSDDATDLAGQELSVNDESLRRRAGVSS